MQGIANVAGMETGAAIFITSDTPDPGSVARLVEARGHTSLFFSEHTHIPAAQTTPYPGGGDTPWRFTHAYELFVSMTAAAVATTSLRIGSGVCLVIQRDPIITAKAVASLDAVSGGRIEFGIGSGWNRQEMQNHGTDPRRRLAILAERVEAMKVIWSEDEATYHGEHVNFDRIWSWPKPAQRPHPPILVGGTGPTVVDRVLRYGDAWMPNNLRDNTLERVKELQARAERPIALFMMNAPADAQVIDDLERAGFRQAIHLLPSGSRGQIEASLDKFEAAVAEARGTTW